jgi:hypothetical protein
MNKGYLKNSDGGFQVAFELIWK